MDRIINVKIGGNYLSKDSNNAGTRGEANATILRITFDEGWDGFAKSVVFWDAHGLNPTRLTLTTNMWEKDEEKPEETPRTYLVPIPKEALGIAGEVSFKIEGYNDEGVRQVSVTDTLEVHDSLVTDLKYDPTPTQAEQLQVQIDSIAENIYKAEVYRDDAATLASQAGTAKSDTEVLKNEVESIKAEVLLSKEASAGFAENAKTYANHASDYASKAVAAAQTLSVIGANGNWFLWDANAEEYIDSGVRAQAGSEVYLGDNPPDSADVWVKPDGGPDDIMSRLTALEAIVARLTVRTTTISLLASAWVEDGTGCYQVVEVPGVTSYSKVDLQPTAEQLAIFYEKDVSFVTENDNGVVTVYCIGTKPANDYIIQATITEVTGDV